MRNQNNIVFQVLTKKNSKC